MCIFKKPFSRTTRPISMCFPKKNSLKCIFLSNSKAPKKIPKNILSWTNEREYFFDEQPTSEHCFFLRNRILTVHQTCDSYKYFLKSIRISKLDFWTIFLEIKNAIEVGLFIISPGSVICWTIGPINIFFFIFSKK